VWRNGGTFADVDVTVDVTPALLSYHGQDFFLFFFVLDFSFLQLISVTGLIYSWFCILLVMSPHWRLLARFWWHVSLLTEL